MEDLVIVTSGVPLPHGMDGYNRNTKTFIRWIHGRNMPIPSDEKIPSSITVCGKSLKWNTNGFYEMNQKHSMAYLSKVESTMKENNPHSALSKTVHRRCVDEARPTIKHVAFESECGKMKSFTRGALVYINDGVLRGRVGAVLGQSAPNPSCYIVRTEASNETNSEVIEVSYLHLSLCQSAHSQINIPADRRGATSSAGALDPGDGAENAPADSSSAVVLAEHPQHAQYTYKPDKHLKRKWNQECQPPASSASHHRTPPSIHHTDSPTQNTLRHTDHNTFHSTPHYAKGSAVCVVEGSYKGCSGVVQGLGRAGKMILSGQFRVLVGGIPVILPACFLRPLHRTNVASPVDLSPAVAEIVDLTVSAPLPSPPQVAETLPLSPPPPSVMAPELEEDLRVVAALLLSEEEGSGDASMCTTFTNTQAAERLNCSDTSTNIRSPTACATHTPTSFQTASNAVNTNQTVQQDTPLCDLQALAQISAIYVDAGDLEALVGLFMFK